MTKEEKRIFIGIFAFFLFFIIHFTWILSNFAELLAFLQVMANGVFLVLWIKELSKSRKHLDVIGGSMGVAMPIVFAYFTITRVLL
jgi:sensor histidine kinase YesM